MEILKKARANDKDFTYEFMDLVRELEKEGTTRIMEYLEERRKSVE